MKKIVLFILFMFIALEVGALTEKDYQNAAAGSVLLSGETNVYLSNPAMGGVYADILVSGEPEIICTVNNDCIEIPTVLIAVEVDFSNKYYEGLMQTALYAKRTNSRAGLLLIIDTDKNSINATYTHLSNAIELIEFYKMPIDIYFIEYIDGQYNIWLEYVSQYTTNYHR